MTTVEAHPTGGACGSCGAQVIWAVTINGRRMPVDAEPSPKGNLHLEHTDHLGQPLPVPLVRVVNAHLNQGVPLRTSHFVTCPHAPAWRKRPGGRETR